MSHRPGVHALQQAEEMESPVLLSTDNGGPTTSADGGAEEEQDVHGPPVTVKIKKLQRPKDARNKNDTFTADEMLTLQNDDGMSRRRMFEDKEGMPLVY